MKRPLLTVFLLFYFTLVNAADSNSSHCTTDLSYGCLDTRILQSFWYGSPNDENVSKYLSREKTFAKYSWKHAIASSVVYKRESHEEPLPKLENLGWKNILCSSDKSNCVQNEEDDIGFYADAWLTENHEIVIAFRGTDSVWKDFFKGNLAFAPLIFGRTQFDAALDFSRDILDQAENEEFEFYSVIFTGHSLGGGLAQFTQRFFDKSKSIVFDPSPNRGRLYSLFTLADSQPLNAVRVYEKGEILESFRKGLDPDFKFDWEPNKLGKSTIWMDFYDDGPSKAHSIRDFAMSLIKLSAIDGDNTAAEYLSVIDTTREKNYKATVM
ncbi:Mbeg1-like protein [Microbulbifer rhizosphaerae]|uniref:Lipase (Class 3) n=1 Tax=Microbulbifer rhizosphaerae TaxID=1562603 RepID=A0A7W4Z9A3_9GAMM|nr:Mbeg1-like protein [Microbulbifer rhizosphaerae]MBB3061391.1 hypothetical protein [Microbulbifer rhizosphaerae]